MSHKRSEVGTPSGIQTRLPEVLEVDQNDRQQIASVTVPVADHRLARYH